MNIGKQVKEIKVVPIEEPVGPNPVLDPEPVREPTPEPAPVSEPLEPVGV